MTTFKEYQEQILIPMLIRCIENGNFDDFIFDDVLDLFYKDDTKILDAINERRKVLNDNARTTSQI